MIYEDLNILWPSYPYMKANRTKDWSSYRRRRDSGWRRSDQLQTKTIFWENLSKRTKTRTTYLWHKGLRVHLDRRKNYLTPTVEQYQNENRSRIPAYRNRIPETKESPILPNRNGKTKTTNPYSGSHSKYCKARKGPYKEQKQTVIT